MFDFDKHQPQEEQLPPEQQEQLPPEELLPADIPEEEP